MSVTPLSAGQNAPLPDTTVRVEVTGAVDLTALVLGASGTVSGDADMVFFNQTTAPGARLTGSTLDLTLGSLRPGAERVVLVASPATDGQTFATVGGVAVTLTSGPFAARYAPEGLSTETALVLCEVYLRGGAWKVRAVGQGYADGLAGLARDFGVDVADEPATPTAPTAPTAPPPPVATPAPAPEPAVSLTKGAEKLPAPMRETLDLRKKLVTVSLEKKGAAGLRARVIGVLDVSGSTAGLYRRGVFTRAVERIMPVAAALDDDAEMQMFLMGARGVRVDDLQVGDLPQWLERWTSRRPAEAGGVNNERAVIDEVLRYVATQPADVPTLVLFFHDGGVTDNRGTEAAIRAAVPSPVFWQFIGLGRSNYGILARLDDLQGRTVDNTGFFALDDIDAVPDSALYDRLVHEFPDWVRAYYPAGHPARVTAGR
ncbi:stress protein [Cellulomonas sp. H30R-01]|uniref:vWA domain-containing protein n=1 Tax=Cellulomonas sp. H30R-01 TaxID=2704467 RepID=UPI00138B99FF|nr:VWA domain-containing protein [Cellulomonas sp. H30R-01]QHT55672.1 stress protein [Cellulomonas sp. H30R-01]